MPFSPTDIAGCILWLKADAGVYKDAGVTLCADGDTVQQWNDQSGSGHNATQATSTKRPVYKSGILNSLPVIRHDTTDDGLVASGANPSPSYSIFCVYNQTAANGTRRAVNGVSNNWLIGPYSGFHNYYANGWVTTGSAGPAVIVSRFVCASAVCSGSVNNFWINGSQYSSNSTNVGTPGGIATGGAGAFNDPLGGDIAEVIVYNSALSTSDRQSVEGYLVSRYSLTIPIRPVVSGSSRPVLIGGQNPLQNRSGLIWRFDEKDGSTAYDLLQTYDGTIVNSPTRTSTGVVLNGTSQYITNTGVPTTVNISYESFVKPTVVDSTYRTVWYNYGKTWRMYQNSSNKWELFGIINSNITVVAEKLTHIVVSFNNSTVTLFINGNSVGSASLSNSAAAANELRVGVDPFSQYFKGTIALFRVYLNRTLGLGEVRALYSNPFAPDQPSLTNLSLLKPVTTVPSSPSLLVYT